MSKRPKDMTEAQIKALPERGVGGTRCEKTYNPKTGLTHVRPILEKGRAITKLPDDIIAWFDDDGRMWEFGMDLEDNWYRYPA